MLKYLMKKKMKMKTKKTLQIIKIAAQFIYNQTVEFKRKFKRKKIHKKK
jgi:hypothetical protein